MQRTPLILTFVFNENLPLGTSFEEDIICKIILTYKMNYYNILQWAKQLCDSFKIIVVQFCTKL